MQLIRLYKDAFEGLNGEVWKLSFMMLINRMGTLILPFLTLYTTQELGWTAVQGASAASSFGLGSLAGAYLGGVLTDRIGYYKTMAYGLLIAGVLFFAAQHIDGYLALCLALFVSSLAADTLRPALYTGLAFITDDSTRTRAISLMRMAFNLGFAIGPAIAGLTIGIFGYRSIFILDGITCILAGIFLLRYIADHNVPRAAMAVVDEVIVEKQTAGGSPYRDPAFLVFLLSNVFMLTAFFSIVFMVPLYMKNDLGLTEAHVGVFYALNGMIVFVVEMPLIRYIEQQGYSKYRFMIYGAVMMGTGLLCLLLPVSYLLALVFYLVLVSVGEIINFPFISTTAMERAQDTNRGKYMGLTSMSFSVAIIVSPKVGAYFLDAYGFDGLWLCMGLLNFLGVAGYLMVQSSFQQPAVV